MARAKVKEVFQVLKDFVTVLPVIAAYKQPGDDAKVSLGKLFQDTAAGYADKTALIFEGRELSWAEFNALANQFAHRLKQQGLKRGDAVALLMENRIEFLACLVAVAKIGAVSGLINTSLTGRSLIHCINSVESKKCIVGQELLGSIKEVRSELSLQDNDYLWVRDQALPLEQGNENSRATPSWAVNISTKLDDMPTENLPETDDIRAGEEALYIFTSGTTGLPKASLIYHRRYLSAAILSSQLGLRAKAVDRIYLCLPLFHLTGLATGVGTSFVSGASIYLRRRFSASNFWPEVQQYQTNLFVYVGELCRYLAMQAECPEEYHNPLQTISGNGLRADVWDSFRERFKVGRISEFYGSSEGNVGFSNLFNKDKTIGTTTGKIILVQYDIEADEMVRDSNGKLIEAEPGEAGLLLGQIDQRFLFDGYKNQLASESKIVRNVRKSGDAWFNTGDLIRQIDAGFAMGFPHYQFVDRVGDTFRWRSENVSTNEVGEILSGYHQVAMANVYGVEIPGIEGKAGMAAITLKDGNELDLSAFSAFSQQALSSFSRPVFIRVQSSAETTATFKLFKGRLRQEAYHLDQVSEPVYVLKPGTTEYVPLDQNYYQQILHGKSGF